MTGWAGGWGIVAADVLVMASLAQVAGQYVFLLFGANSIGNDAASVWVNDAAGRIEIAARHALAAMSEGDVLRTELAALRRLLKVTPVNTVAMRRRLADATVAKGGYLFA